MKLSLCSLGEMFGSVGEIFADDGGIHNQKDLKDPHPIQATRPSTAFSLTESRELHPNSIHYARVGCLPMMGAFRSKRP